MTTTLTRRRLLGGCGAAGLAALAGCSGATPLVGRRTESSETIDPEDSELLSVDVSVGDVAIDGDDRDVIDIDIVKQSSSIRTDLENLHFEHGRDDERLELRSVWEGSEGFFRSRPSMDLDIAMPRALAIDRIDTSTGRVTVRNIEGEMTLDTTTGRVTAENVDGSIVADTTTGRVVIEDVTGTVSADSTTGRIDVRDVGQIGDLSATTGRISTDVPAIDGDTSISTSTGRVSASIDPDLDAELVVETNTGGISVDGLDLEEGVREDDRVTGTLGEGGPTLRIETSTGRISLDRLA